MKRSLSATFLIASFAFAFGCQPPPPEDSASESVDAALLDEEGPEALAFQLPAHDWCVVEMNGQPFEAKGAVTITYLQEGYALLKSIRANEGQTVIEEGGAARWSLKDDLLVYEDLFSGEVSEKRVALTEEKAPTLSGAIWNSAVSKEAETCLRVEDLASSATELHCPCEMDKIWEHQETLSP